MATPSPYRSLSPERRLALVTHAIKASRDSRTIFMHRLASRPGGFRTATLQSWPPDKLAREVVRQKAETSQDEFDLLHLLYVELEPSIQVAFLDAAGVPHEEARMPDDLDTPYTDAESVTRAAAVVREQFGAEGERYLRTLARYNPDGWPGITPLTSEA